MLEDQSSRFHYISHFQIYYSLYSIHYFLITPSFLVRTVQIWRNSLIFFKRRQRLFFVSNVFTHWINVFGPPKNVMTDNGGKYVNNSFMDLCEKLDFHFVTIGAEAQLCDRFLFTKLKNIRNAPNIMQYHCSRDSYNVTVQNYN